MMDALGLVLVRETFRRLRSELAYQEPPDRRRQRSRQRRRR
jgi:hypothetical protein